ncbi:hypothetical protein [Silvibacterium sp.]|uniref:hypothetical protein n=1 Tax=Silvibacterium sp. TaxID=1964179 RepID=UPI0039E724EF
MKRALLLCSLLAMPSLVSAQTTPIAPGSTVFIEPMDGYETYLSAAFLKKQVPLTVVSDKTKAQFLIESTLSHTQPDSPEVVIQNSNSIGGNSQSDTWDRAYQSAQAARAARGATSASISVIDRVSTQVVFAYSVGKSRNTNQEQSAAEACAKHLKEFIEKAEKSGK